MLSSHMVTSTWATLHGLLSLHWLIGEYLLILQNEAEIIEYFAKNQTIVKLSKWARGMWLSGKDYDIWRKVMLVLKQSKPKDICL